MIIRDCNRNVFSKFHRIRPRRPPDVRMVWTPMVERFSMVRSYFLDVWLRRPIRPKNIYVGDVQKWMREFVENNNVIFVGRIGRISISSRISE